MNLNFSISKLLLREFICNELAQKSECRDRPISCLQGIQGWFGSFSQLLSSHILGPCPIYCWGKLKQGNSQENCDNKEYCSCTWPKVPCQGNWVTKFKSLSWGCAVTMCLSSISFSQPGTRVKSLNFPVPKYTTHVGNAFTKTPCGRHSFINYRTLILSSTNVSSPWETQCQS